MNERGSITVYLSLILTVVLALVCTLIESGRINALEAKANGITYMGLDSSFADYASPLFIDYGLLFLWLNNESFDDKLEGYLSYNTNINKGLIVNKMDLFKMELKDIDVTELYYATDNNGEVFEAQVQEYMKYALVGNIIEEILGQIDLFGQSSAVKNFYNKIDEYKDVFAGVEEKVGEIQESIDKVKQIADNPKDIINEMLNLTNNIKSNSISGIDYTTYLEEYKNQYNLLSETKIKLQQNFQEIKDKTEKYVNAANEAKSAISTLNNELSTSKDLLEYEIYGLLDGELQDLSNKVTNNEMDFYGILNNSNLLNENTIKINQLDSFLTGKTVDISENNIDKIVDSLQAISKTFGEFDINNLGVNYDVGEGSKEDNSILDYIQNLINEGILGLVIKDTSEISLEALKDIEDLPSQNYLDSNNKLGDSIIDTTRKKIIYSEYLINHFGNYVNPLENTKLLYELEYIINGSLSDKENISGVISKIVLLREGCNLIYLLKDSVKRGEAYQMATALVGFTGMPILISITQFLVLAAWAYAESILDVKNLLAGEKVPIIKNASEWNLSLSGVKNLSGSTDSSKSVTDRGLDYQQYLRILLIKQNKIDQIFRTMDLIQLNIGKRENDSFKFDECISKASVNVSYSAKSQFITLPFVRNLFGYKKGRYHFEIMQQYKY